MLPYCMDGSSAEFRASYADVLRRASLHETRFRAPGLAPDSRGIALGDRAGFLFASYERAVAFLCAGLEQGVLRDAVSTLMIERLVTRLRTRDFLVTITAESSYRVDACAQLARLLGGQVFTGTNRHFVQYRDTSAPAGYDITELHNQADSAAYVLYAASFTQAYEVENTHDIRAIVMRTPPRQTTLDLRAPRSRVIVTAPLGLGRALVTYLLQAREHEHTVRTARGSTAAKDALTSDRGGTEFRARVAQLPSPFPGANAGVLYLFELDDPPPRIVAMLHDMPGVLVFVVEAPGFAVRFGYRSSLPLSELQSILATGESADKQLILSAPEPHGTVVISRNDVSVDVMHAVATSDALLPRDAETLPATSLTAADELRIPLRVVSSAGATTTLPSTAHVVPRSEISVAAQLLARMPCGLDQLECALTNDQLVVRSNLPLDGFVLGKPFVEIARRVYIPVGRVITPTLSRDELSRVVRASADIGADDHVFLSDSPGNHANDVTIVKAHAFVPVSARAQFELLARSEEVASLPRASSEPLPEFAFEPRPVAESDENA